MTALIWIPLVVPPALGIVAATHRRASWARLVDVAAAVTILVTGLVLLAAVAAAGPQVTGAGMLRADALTAYLLTTIGAVAVTALWGGLATRTRADGWFTGLVCLFLTAMSLAVLADNLGIVWVAVEATTITTAFLVGYHHGRRPLEAAWKYVVLGSVGVAIAFLGVVLLYAATRAAGHPTLSWVEVTANAARLDPAVTKVSVALMALGFATKAGLAPMHSWLPDAHSQAPASVSGLMSGVLLSVALYAILRVKVISDAVLGEGFMRWLLITAGLLSLAVAAALILTQRDYKRMLAYSSIEHMGLMAVGTAIGGPLALTAVLVHMLGHGLAKAAMFVQAGRILASEGSTRTGEVRGLLARRPDQAGPFLAGTAALLGFPPFVLFFTDVAIIVAGWQRGLGVVAAATLLLLLLVFVGLSRHVLAMTLGPVPVDAGTPVSGGGGATQTTARSAQLPVVLALTVTALLVLVLWPLAGTFSHAVAALGGGS